MTDVELSKVITTGLCDGFIKILTWIVIVYFISMLIGNGLNLSLDDSDKDGWNRSGLSIRTDHKTGLQYFQTTGGGITPRLDKDGKQMRVDQ